MALRFLRKTGQKVRSPTRVRSGYANATDRQDSHRSTQASTDVESSFASSRFPSDEEEDEESNTAESSHERFFVGSDDEDSSSASGSQLSDTNSDSEGSHSFSSEDEYEHSASSSASSRSSSEYSSSDSSGSSGTFSDSDCCSCGDEQLTASQRLVRMANEVWLSSGEDTDDSDPQHNYEETKSKSKLDFQKDMRNFINQAADSVDQQQRLVARLRTIQQTSQSLTNNNEARNRDGNNQEAPGFRVGGGSALLHGIIRNVHGVSAGKLCVKVSYFEASNDRKIDVALAPKIQIHCTKEYDIDDAMYASIGEGFNFDIEPPLRYRDNFDEDIVQISDWDAVKGCLLFSCYNVVKQSRHFLGQMLVPLRKLVDGSSWIELHGLMQSRHEIVGSLTQRDGTSMAAGEIQVELQLELPDVEPLTPRNFKYEGFKSTRKHVAKKGDTRADKSKKKLQRAEKARRKQAKQLREMLRKHKAVQRRKKAERTRKRIQQERRIVTENQHIAQRILTAKRQTARSIRKQQRPPPVWGAKPSSTTTHNRSKKGLTKKTKRSKEDAAELLIKVEELRKRVKELKREKTALRQALVQGKVKERQKLRNDEQVAEALMIKKSSQCRRRTSETRKSRMKQSTCSDPQKLASLRAQVLAIANQLQQRRAKTESKETVDRKLRATIKEQLSELADLKDRVHFTAFRGRNRGNSEAVADNEVVTEKMVNDHNKIEEILRHERKSKLETALYNGEISKLRREHERERKRLELEVEHFEQKLKRKESKCKEYAKKIQEVQESINGSSKGDHEAEKHIEKSRFRIADLNQDPEVTQLKAHISSLCAAISTARQQNRKNSLMC